MKQDDPIRKILLDYKVEVDKNKLWEKTSFAIPQKRKRRALPLILLTGAILLGAGYYNHALHLTSTNTLSTKETTTDAQPLTSAPSVISENHELTSIPDDAYRASIDHPDRHNSENKQDHTTLFNNATNHHSETPTDHNEIHNDVRDAVKLASNVTTQKADESLSSLDKISFNPSAQERLSPEQTNSNQNSPAGSVQPFPIQTVQYQEEYQHARFSIAADQLMTLPIQNVRRVKKKEFESPQYLSSITPAKNKKNFSISIMQGIGLSDVHIITSNPELYPVRDKWKNNVHSLESVSTQLEGSISITKGIQLGVGFQYSRLTSLLDYTHVTTERITGEGTTTIIVDENGQEQSITGTQDFTRETHIHSKRYTYHTKVDLESSLLFRLYHDHRIYINALLKGGVNIFYSAQGAAFDTHESVFSFTASDNPYTLSSPFTFGAGLDAEYILNKHLKLMSSLSYDQFSFNHKLFNDQLQMKHSVFSLALGTGYIF